MTISFIDSEIFIDKFEDEKNDKALLIFPGFPAGKNKNEYLAETLVKCGINVYIVHYRGIGDSKGIFTFSKSLNDSEKVLKFIFEKYATVNILGHSWGGYLSLNLIENYRHKIDKFALLSPLTHKITTKEVVDAALVQFFDNEKRRKNKDHHFLVNDFYNQKFEDLLKEFDQYYPLDDLLIVHGKEDIVVPYTDSENLLKYKYFNNAKLKVVANEGHDFDNIDLLKEYFKEYFCENAY